MSQFKQIVNKTLKPYIKPIAEIDHQNLIDLMLQCKIFISFDWLQSLNSRLSIIIVLEYYINGNCSEEKIDKAITLIPDSQEYFHEALTGLIILCQLYLRSPKGFVKSHELQEAVTDTK